MPPRIPMPRIPFICGAIGLTVVAVAAFSAEPAGPKFSAEQLTFYEKEVLPLLKQHCYECHGGEKVKGSLWLTTRETILEGGDLGPAVDLDKPAESNLLQALHYKDKLKMPPKGKL